MEAQSQNAGARPFLMSDLLQKTTPLKGGTIHELGNCNSA